MTPRDIGQRTTIHRSVMSSFESARPRVARHGSRFMVFVGLPWALVCLMGQVSCKPRTKPDKVPGLLAQLSGADSAKQHEAARELSEVTTDPRLLRPMARLLLNKDLNGFAERWFKKVGERAIGASPWICALARGKVHPQLGPTRDKPDGRSRRLAIEILGHLRGPRACDTLVALLEDPDAAIWQRAQALLRRPNTECMPAMVRALAHHSKRWIRVWNILANWEPRPREAFLKALRTPYVEARRALVKMLLGDPQPWVTTALLGQLKHPHWKVRRQALKSLGNPRRKLTAAQLAVIRKRLADPDVDVLAQAAWVVSERKDRLAEEQLLRLYRWRPAKVPGYAHSEEWRMAGLHRRVAEALIAIKSERGFLAVLANLSVKPGHGHYEALGHSKDRQALKPLLAALEKATAEHTLVQILQGLGLLGFVEARPALERRLEHKKRRVRLAAIRALGTLGDAKAVPALLRRLKEPEYQVVTSTLEALERYAGPALLPGLCALLKNPKALASTLEQAVRILRQIKSPKATGCLVTALGLSEKDKRYQVHTVLKDRIIEAIGEVADAGAINALISRLKAPAKPPSRTPRGGTMITAPRSLSPVVKALRRLAERHPASAAKIGQALKGKGH